jgi:hypothetical protein
MSHTRRAHERIKAEILGEKAAALGRAGERLEAALEGVTAIALHARLALVIQREALGLRQHRMVDQQFPEPPHRPRPV